MALKPLIGARIGSPSKATNAMPVAKTEQVAPPGKKTDGYLGVMQIGTGGSARPELFPFSQGKGGKLSPPVDFSRFADLPKLTDSDVQQALKPVLLDYVRTGRFGELTGEGGVALRYAVFDPPPGVPIKGVINLVGGRTESFVKYAETLYDLRDLRAQGWVIASMDHRGQGFSGRELQDVRKDHVGNFEDFVSDEQKFTDVLREHFGKDVPLSFMAHSMGAAIATRYLEEHPGEYQKAVLLSPMFDIQTGYSAPMESIIADVAGSIAPSTYALGRGPYEKSEFANNHSTNSPGRFAVQEALSEMFPETNLGGPTWGWLKQAVGATRKLMQPDQLARLKNVDVHLLRSTGDALVEPEAQDRFASTLGIEAKSYFIERDGQKLPTQHELLNHTDDVRDRVLADVRAILTA